jgi:hypothetical protein
MDGAFRLRLNASTASSIFTVIFGAAKRKIAQAGVPALRRAERG